MAIIAIMTAASAAVHWKNGFFATKGGFELPFLIAAAASSVAVAGPGSYSLDALLGVPVAGTSFALGAVVLGVVLGLAVVGSRDLPKEFPFRKPQTHS
jgi:putative oxidoreductase